MAQQGGGKGCDKPSAKELERDAETERHVAGHQQRKAGRDREKKGRKVSLASIDEEEKEEKEEGQQHGGREQHGGCAPVAPVSGDDDEACQQAALLRSGRWLLRSKGCHQKLDCMKMKPTIKICQSLYPQESPYLSHFDGEWAKAGIVQGIVRDMRFTDIHGLETPVVFVDGVEIHMVYRGDICKGKLKVQTGDVHWEDEDIWRRRTDWLGGFLKEMRWEGGWTGEGDERGPQEWVEPKGEDSEAHHWELVKDDIRDQEKQDKKEKKFPKKEQATQGRLSPLEEFQVAEVIRFSAASGSDAGALPSAKKEEKKQATQFFTIYDNEAQVEKVD